MKIFKYVSSLVFVVISVVACGPSVRTVREGDPVTVRFNAGFELATRASDCKLPVSHLVATSKKFGTVTAELAATVDADTVFTATSGSSVLSFSDVQPITLSASDDWVFQYIGIFGFDCDTSGGSRVMSAGATEAVSVMSDNTQVPIEIQTLTSMDLAIGNTAPFPQDSVFSKATLKIPVATASPCSGHYELKLKDGTSLTSYQSGYGSFLPAGGFVTFTLSPLPKNMSYELILYQNGDDASTITMTFSTTSADLINIDIPAISGFCPVNALAQKGDRR